MENIIQVEDLVFEYPGKRALHEVSCAIEKGSITALVGPNGSGKTTLMRCIAALERPLSGSVLVNGNDTQDDPRSCHSLIGYLSDSFGLYDDLLVSQCLRHAAAMHGFVGREEAARVERVAAEVGTQEFMSVRAGSLSRGQRQRVGLAQALIHDPQLLILDEPASGLDPEARVELANLLVRLRSRGCTVLVSSHILAELEGYSTAMLTLEKGRVLGHVAVGSTKLSRHLKAKVATGSDLDLALRFFSNQLTVSAATVRDGAIAFAFTGSEDEQSQLLLTALTAGVKVTSFAEEKQQMQEVYLGQLAEKRGLSAERSDSKISKMSAEVNKESR